MSMMRVLSWDGVMDPMELFMDCPILDDGRIWPLFLKNTMLSNLNKQTQTIMTIWIACLILSLSTVIVLETRCLF